MRISKSRVKKLLAEAANSEGMHMTMQGEIIPFGCPECIDDLDHRINDMTVSRDSCNRGTAARAHYNGVLGDLRMKKRSALKHSQPVQVISAPDEIEPEAADDELLRQVVASMVDDQM